MAGNWRLLRSQDQAFQHHAKMMDSCEPDFDDGLSVSRRFYYFVTEGSGGQGNKCLGRSRRAGCHPAVMTRLKDTIWPSLALRPKVAQN